MMRFLEVRRREVRVNLRGGKARMAKHLLNAAKIGFAFEKVSRERMSHVVRTQTLVEPGLADGSFEHDANRIGAHGIAPR